MKIGFFGDSLTDDGKFGMLEPPSFEGRFTRFGNLVKPWQQGDGGF